MTSRRFYDEAFVWVWLPEQTEPVVAGRLSRAGNALLFNYGKSYLERPDAIALYDRELPLRAGTLPLPGGLSMPGCIRDASPDAWGRRVIINRKLGSGAAGADTAELDELTYLLESGSDRVGALDFQLSPTEYVPRLGGRASLEELQQASEKVMAGVALSQALDNALNHGTSIGGARPKALITADGGKYVAKFSASSDLYSVVKMEFVAMQLASLAGLNVAPVRLVQSAGRDVLLVERFDRRQKHDGWARKIMVSALTLLELDEMMARYASYEDLAEIIRHRFAEPKSTLRELYARMVFNVLCGNTDDHARNHAAFWDGRRLSLTPAYDICPQSRAGGEASQAMLIHGNNRLSRIDVCIAAHNRFLLSENEARMIVNRQIACIEDNWQHVCDKADISEVDRKLMWRRQFLNPSIFY